MCRRRLHSGICILRICWDWVTFLVQREGLAQGSACNRTCYVDLSHNFWFPGPEHCKHFPLRTAFSSAGLRTKKPKALTFTISPGSLGPNSYHISNLVNCSSGQVFKSKVQHAEKNWEKERPQAFRGSFSLGYSGARGLQRMLH